MKTTILLMSLMIAGAALGEEQMIKTRSGKVYEKAEITKQDANAISISYSDGVATIPLEDLPAELQKKIGYTAKAEREAPQAAQAKDKALAEEMDKDAKAGADKLKKETLAAEKPLTSIGASKRFYGKTEAEIYALYGEPMEVKQSKGDGGEGTAKELLYEKGKETAFVIENGAVSFGYFKGEFFQNPAKLREQALRKAQAEK